MRPSDGGIGCCARETCSPSELMSQQLLCSEYFSNGSAEEGHWENTAPVACSTELNTLWIWIWNGNGKGLEALEWLFGCQPVLSRYNEAFLEPFPVFSSPQDHSLNHLLWIKSTVTAPQPSSLYVRGKKLIDFGMAKITNDKFGMTDLCC